MVPGVEQKAKVTAIREAETQKRHETARAKKLENDRNRENAARKKSAENLAAQKRAELSKERTPPVAPNAPQLPIPSVTATGLCTCPFCTETIQATAVKCKHCGEFLDGSSKISRSVAEKKLILPAFFLLIFFNGLGVHAFYAGRTKQGVAYIAMYLIAGFFLLLPEPLGIAGLALILAIAVFLLDDLIRLISGNYKDGDGNTMVDWL